QHVSAVHWNTGAVTIAPLQNESGISVEPLVRARNYIDRSVLHNRVDDCDVDDHEVTRKGPVDVVMLSVAPWEIEVTANVRHTQDIGMQLLHQVDDPPFLQGVVREPRART